MQAGYGQALDLGSEICDSAGVGWVSHEHKGHRSQMLSTVRVRWVSLTRLPPAKASREGHISRRYWHMQVGTGHYERWALTHPFAKRTNSSLLFGV